MSSGNVRRFFVLLSIYTSLASRSVRPSVSGQGLSLYPPLQRYRRRTDSIGG
ncbi:hypothetical protein PF005_g27636 [Phytophthora fragariae]|uniref:RxLR effector protein n=1 Tax=Phytophthora fragariae TaxID=53985 RepID=A0A6A3W8T6_9STRA|nr:hypothetical protein PF003_g17232 [Phytophthora fragariae]KAE8924096.1 hypothetical protein PF009_g25669 [Phytophthora fragariae]KAE8968151.1 hypothetical protein PF011_g27289 [Phytophthora fragariae]KAE9066177.1 hypothetical protein PF010_g27911 [Phytophthora fragariae]KAE9068994.1 hypothetical protein PF007_g27486 [Phytophthora fragariae]